MTTTKHLPTDLGTYRIIRRAELTDDQLAVLRSTSRARVHERLLAMVGDGRLALSQVHAGYGALMAEVGHAVLVVALLLGLTMGCSAEGVADSPDADLGATQPARGPAVQPDAGAADTRPQADIQSAPLTCSTGICMGTTPLDAQPAPVTVPDTDALDARPCVAPAGVCVYSTGSAIDALVTACYANGAIVQKGVATGVTIYTTTVAGRVCDATATAPAGFPSGNANDPATTCTPGLCTP
jgi:hypothetical protein